MDPAFLVAVRGIFAAVVVSSTENHPAFFTGDSGAPRHIARDHVDKRWHWIQAVLSDPNGANS